MFYIEFAPKDRYEKYIDWTPEDEYGYKTFADALYILTSLLKADYNHGRLNEYLYRIVEDWRV